MLAEAYATGLQTAPQDLKLRGNQCARSLKGGLHFAQLSKRWLHKHHLGLLFSTVDFPQWYLGNAQERQLAHRTCVFGLGEAYHRPFLRAAKAQ